MKILTVLAVVLTICVLGYFIPEPKEPLLAGDIIKHCQVNAPCNHCPVTLPPMDVDSLLAVK